MNSSNISLTPSLLFVAGPQNNSNNDIDEFQLLLKTSLELKEETCGKRKSGAEQHSSAKHLVENICFDFVWHVEAGHFFCNRSECHHIVAVEKV